MKTLTSTMKTTNRSEFFVGKQGMAKQYSTGRERPTKITAVSYRSLGRCWDVCAGRKLETWEATISYAFTD